MRATKFLLFLILIIFFSMTVYASELGSSNLFAFPKLEDMMRLISLKDYNTRVVLLGTMLLGLASGIIGSFMLLRKRSLMGDAVSHATLPGIGIAFIIMTILGGTGKNLLGLLTGALIAGLIGMGLIILIRSVTRLKEEAALGIVLSVFFGFGVAILGIIQKMRSGHAAGLESFIYGKTASMLASDAWLIAIAASVIVILSILLFKEFKILCFDQDFAESQGWPVFWLDFLLMSLVVGVTVIGLQAVGLILIIAFLIIPPAAARFWTEHLLKMIIIAGFIGALSGAFGAGLSALYAKLPAGAIIVVVTSIFFLISMIFGSSRGVLNRVINQIKLVQKVNKQHLLRALYELLEKKDKDEKLCFEELLEIRSWSKLRLKFILWTLKNAKLIKHINKKCEFTEEGYNEAYRIVRNHRLWELYLITHADIATGKVDRDADEVEHVLGKEMIKELENTLAEKYPDLAMPKTPHEIYVES